MLRQEAISVCPFDGLFYASQHLPAPDHSSGAAFISTLQNLRRRSVFEKRTGHRLLFSWKSYPGGQLLYTLFFAVSLAPMLCLSASAAEDVTIWTKASEIMQDVYSQILKISTVAAVVTAAIALLMTNFSRSGRTVEESRAWLKRIVITWVILNGLGFILAYITPFFEGGQYTFTS